MHWVTFWANFSQTHLVTLGPDHIVHKSWPLGVYVPTYVHTYIYVCSDICSKQALTHLFWSNGVPDDDDAERDGDDAHRQDVGHKAGNVS
jgi:hypothetical protein